MASLNIVMVTFHDYLTHMELTEQRNRVVRLLATRTLHPQTFVYEYLESSSPVLTENVFGNFFKRIGNAWRSFWSDPNPDPAARLEAAKKAISDLHQMIDQNKDIEPRTFQMVLNGLESSLKLLGHVQPHVQDLSPHVAQKDTGGKMLGAVLPQDLQEEWNAIHNEGDQIVKMSDADPKKLDLLKGYDAKLTAFFDKIEKEHRSLNPTDASTQERKQQLEKFLQYADNDAAYKDIKNLLTYARRGPGQERVADRPPSYQQAVMELRKIAQNNPDQNAQKQAMLQWYDHIPYMHDIKRWIQTQARDNPGHDEHELFWQYLQDWTNKFAHHGDPNR